MGKLQFWLKTAGKNGSRKQALFIKIKRLRLLSKALCMHGDSKIRELKM